MNSAPPTEHKPPTESNGARTTEPIATHPPTPTDPANPAPAKQARNPRHGITLEAMVVGLADYFGWDELGRQIPIRCFQIDPSVGSSLKFLRKTPWAREKVESLYLFMLRERKRNA